MPRGETKETIHFIFAYPSILEHFIEVGPDTLVLHGLSIFRHEHALCGKWSQFDEYTVGSHWLV